MKCRLSSEFKTLAFELAIVTVTIISIFLIVIGFVSGIGYIALHWFDLIFVTKASSPSEFYLLQGLIIIFIIATIIASLLLVFILILYPLYYLIFNFKKVVNYIFDCKGN